MGGGYIWSPIRKKDGGFNQTYLNLTLTNIGDTIFSYANTQIKAIGLIKAQYESASVPLDFGHIGNQWDKDGYLVKVEWTLLENPFRPKDRINDLKDLLPSKYSPLQYKNGNGNQALYLTHLSSELGEKLISIINEKNVFLLTDMEKIHLILDEDVEQQKVEMDSISSTDKEQLIKARKGQGLFKANVWKLEKGCRVTGINNISFLTASHIKPWCKSSNFERLDGNNGLLLSPHVDRLFDRGWISFSDGGDMLIKSGPVEEILTKWGIPIKNVGKFNGKQQNYLAYHREKFNFHS